MPKTDAADHLNERETAKRRDEGLRRAMNMPHKPHEPLGKKAKRTSGKGRARVGKAKS